MERASTSSLRLARSLMPSIAAPALRPTSRLFSISPFASPSSTRTALRQPCAAAQPTRLFYVTSAVRSADEPPRAGKSGGDAAPATPSPAATTTATASPSRPSSANLMEGLADLLPSSRSDGKATTSPSAASLFSSSPGSLTGFGDFDRVREETENYQGEFHFAIYAHKHNTHITVSNPSAKTILNVSCGHIGFRKSHRGSYDAAYQLGAYAVDKLYQHSWHKKINKMRVTLRGFGPGRDAVSKILLGPEGRPLRDKISQVADITRIKFGGTRGARPRRLG